MHQILPGLEIQPEIWGIFEEGPLIVEISAEIHKGRYVCTRLELSPTNGGPPGVTAVALRQLRVADMVEKAARHPHVEEKIATGFQRAIEDPEAPDEAPAEYVAAAYRYGYALGDRPSLTVMTLLDLTRAKASRWIATARDLGSLESTTQREAGGVFPDSEESHARMQSLRRQIARVESRIGALEHRQQPGAKTSADQRQHVIENDRNRADRLREDLLAIERDPQQGD